MMDGDGTLSGDASNAVRTREEVHTFPLAFRKVKQGTHETLSHPVYTLFEVL